MMQMIVAEIGNCQNRVGMRYYILQTISVTVSITPKNCEALPLG